MFKELLSALGGGLFKEVRELVDNVVTSTEEKLEIEARLKEKEMDFKQKQDELDLQYQKELSERHRSDMASDSWLSKNVRPLVLLVFVGLLVALSITDGAIGDFVVSESFIDTLETWGTTALMFYFGSRGLEKALKIRKQ